ncbi:hypothetical protein V6259_12605 [Marinomonas sp. TI.3.20]|uniref:hypothetical protein n=1 Tax=Marinomonas sp. TI.3.20 TaxID=3121296 RepID=UPI00311F606A
MQSILNQLHATYTNHSEAIVATVSTDQMINATGNGLQELEIDPRNTVIAQRCLLESSKHFRQLISYCPIINKKGEVLVYLRKKGGNESGLHDLHSIGFGGHVDGVEAQFNSAGGIELEPTLLQAIERELDEELKLNLNALEVEHLAGKYILSNENSVDAVHLGAVSFIRYDGPTYNGEVDVIGIKGFYPLSDLAQFNLESWSSLLAESSELKEFCVNVAKSN